MSKTLDGPSASQVVHACWLPRHRKSAGRARRLLRDFLAGVKCGELYLEVGELLLSELVANAVEHASVPPGRLIRARFEVTGGLLWIEVHDASSEQPAVCPASGDDENGRGLWLVRQLSVAWGVLPRPDGVGKLVWCAIEPVGTGAA
jgi:serine/threonine-protein kinase RsbW